VILRLKGIIKVRCYTALHQAALKKYSERRMPEHGGNKCFAAYDAFFGIFQSAGNVVVPLCQWYY
jgi:hypothetical protein